MDRFGDTHHSDARQSVCGVRPALRVFLPLGFYGVGPAQSANSNRMWQEIDSFLALKSVISLSKQTISDSFSQELPVDPRVH